MTNIRPRVLVADDEELFRSSLVEALSRELPTAELVHVPDGRAALDCIRRTPVDVLVTDVRMPRMDGLRLIAEMTQFGARIPHLVVMSAFASEAEQRWLLANHAFEFVEKPVDLRNLVTVVKRLLEHADRSKIEGMALAGICQLCQVERKTAELRVSSNGRNGVLVFRRGVLVDAVSEDVRGDVAAMEILAWPDAVIRLSGRAPEREASVKSQLGFLLMESMRLQDEQQQRVGSSQELEPAKGDVAMRQRKASSSELRSVRPSNRPVMNLSTRPPPADIKSTARPKPQDVNTSAREPPNATQQGNMGRALAKLSTLDGFVGAALVDAASGVVLGTEGGNGFNLELAGRMNTEVVLAKRKTMDALGLGHDLEDILISLKQQYHVIRPVTSRPEAFIYLVCDRAKANLGLARMHMSEVDRALEF